MRVISKDALIGYALIALVLTIGHACTQKMVDGTSLSASPYTAFTSDSATGTMAALVLTPVERNGMAVYDDLFLQDVADHIEQPVLIKGTECGEYAVAREIYSNGSHFHELLSI